MERTYRAEHSIVLTYKTPKKTYYQLNDAMMKTTEMATYVKRDGKVIPIGSQI